MIIRDIYFKILEPPPSSFQNPTPNVILFPSSIKCIKQRIDKGIENKYLGNSYLMSQLCFRLIWIYWYNSLKKGHSADRDFTFTIFGRGLVQFSTKINGVSQKIILNNALHTPNLHSNLILVSKLGLKSTQVNFTKDSIVVTISDDCPIMSATCFGQLYAVSILESPPICYEMFKH